MDIFLDWQTQVRRSYVTLIVQNAGIVDADATGFAVHCGDGVRRVELSGGLQSADYDYYASILDDVGKATLAMGVLKNALRAASWIDYEIGWRHLSDTHHNRPEEDWLPGLVVEHGFDAIAAEMEQAIRNFHQTNPRRVLSQHPAGRVRCCSGEPTNGDSEPRLGRCVTCSTPLRKRIGFPRSNWIISTPTKFVTPPSICERKHVLTLAGTPQATAPFLGPSSKSHLSPIGNPFTHSNNPFSRGDGHLRADR